MESRKVRRYLLILLCLFWVIDSYAGDSTIVSFAVGNKYAYAGTRHVHGLPYDTPVSYFTEIVADSIVGGRRYFVFSRDQFPWYTLGISDGPVLFRADSASIFRYRISAGKEETFVNFNDSNGTVYPSGNKLLFKTSWPVFRDFYDTVVMYGLTIAKKLFLVWFEIVGIIEETLDLKGAMIEGVVLGDARLVSVESQVPAVPDLRDYVLLQSYPNPSNSSTMIRYGLPTRSPVKLSVYSTLGQEVARLVNEEVDAGYHEVKFDAGGLSSGVYLYRMQAGAYVETKRLLVIR
jgi:hypothetical protein